MKKVICLLFCMLCASGILSAKLLTHFEFENSLEDSVGDNNGTFTRSDSSIYNTGRNGKALVFNGTSDYLEFGKGDFDPAQFGGRYSISMWVLSQEQASSTNNNSYIGKHTSSGDNAILFGYWDEKLSLRIKSDLVQISSISEPANYWAHYVVSAREDNNNGTTSVVIYKNGSQIWSGTLNDVMGTFGNDDNPWTLGVKWDSTNSATDFFKGKMDDLRIYDWDITADEVKEIYYKEAAKIHLTMDDTFNASAGSISGTGFGGATFKQGMENRSAYFDGVNDYVQFGSGLTDPRGSSSTTKKYTISMWVKSDEQATSSNNNTYIAKHTDTNGDVFRFGYWNNKLVLKIGNTSTDISNLSEPTTWTHYVITATENLLALNTVATVYRNGTQIWTGTISNLMGTFTSSYKPWVLGRRLGSVGDYFRGEIDNVRFYGSVLNAAAIQALYRSEFSGVRYCNTDQNSAGCTVVNDTVYNLGQYSWQIPTPGFNGIPIYLPVSHTSIESIKVSDGWEAYLCTQANHQGNCHYYDDGFYNSSNLFFQSIVNNVYSMTVQPSSFSAAKKFFGYKRADDYKDSPSGFAYIYALSDFEKPTKANEFRRLFLNSYDRYNFSGNLQHTITGTNRAASVELYGDVYLEIDNDSNTQGYGYLMTSHNNFNRIMQNYPELDFRQFYNDINYAYLYGKHDNVGSVGLFRANDSYGDDYDLCLRGVYDTINLDNNPTRIECVRFNTINLPFNSGANTDHDEFLSRVYLGNQQKFERYADNYSLLMLSGHGTYSSTVMKIWIPYASDNDNFNIQIKKDGSDPYSKNLGKQNTRWMETTSCKSMGNSNTSWSEVGKIYYNILTRLNGVGGYRKNSSWDGWNDTYNYYDHWHDLTGRNKTVSKAWIDSWSESFIGDDDRDARFLTLEKCDCSDTSCSGTYMKNDYFYNVSTGPKAQKTGLTNYTHYCVRDRESPNFNGIQRSSSKSSQEYPEEFSTYSYDSAPNWLIEQLFDVKIDENSAKFRDNTHYNYKDNYLILTRKDKNISAVINREMASFEDEEESEKTVWDKFNEAKEAAETLTSIELEYAGISRDVNEAFEVGGNGESLGKMINSVIFVFRPIINGIPIFSESIEVEYDAEGFYQLRSNVPYSVSEIKRGTIKSEKQVEEEIYSALGKNEEKIIAYVLNEDGKFILSAVAKDDANETFLTISLEENHD